jgi:hypothetical protein
VSTPYQHPVAMYEYYLILAKSFLDALAPKMHNTTNLK